jgi:hypothetical protein
VAEEPARETIFEVVMTQVRPGSPGDFHRLAGQDSVNVIGTIRRESSLVGYNLKNSAWKCPVSTKSRDTRRDPNPRFSKITSQRIGAVST